MATTWDPANKDASITLSGGNLTADQPSPPGFRSVLATSTHSSGKYMVEVTLNNYSATGPDTPLGIGFGLSSTSTASYFGATSSSFAFFPASGHVYLNNVVIATYALGGGTGDIFDFAIDLGNQTFWVRRNGGNWNNNGSADPATNTGGLSISSLSAGALTVGASFNGAPSVATITANFGATSTTYAVPSGFSTWDIAAVTVNLMGVSGTGAVGSFAPAVSKALTGVSGTGQVGNFSIQASVSINLTGVSGTGAVGLFVPQVSPTLTGVVGTGAVGNFSTSANANVNLTGVSGTGLAGSFVPTISISLRGVQGRGFVGNFFGNVQPIQFPVFTLMRDTPVPSIGRMRSTPVPSIGLMTNKLPVDTIMSNQAVPSIGAMRNTAVAVRGAFI